jgi:alpha-tubulin suppressor-like RCC1 family protein
MTAPRATPRATPRSAAALRATPLGRRWAALSLSVVGMLLAVAALLPASTSAAWQDEVFFSADVTILPSLVPTELDAGAGFTCALIGGDMWCWGEGSAGELGIGANVDADVPVSAVATQMVTGTADHVTAGVRYACGSAGGRAYCWGEGGGKLGNFNVAEPWQTPAVNVPTPVYDLPAGTGNQYQSPLYGQTVFEVVAGDSITCATTTAGTAACWGNVVGLTRPASGPTSWANAPIPVPTSAQNPLSQLPPGAPITSLTTTFENACFIASGIGYCWGKNTEGQLGIGTLGTAQPNPIRIQMAAIPAGTPLTDISAGQFHTCAVAGGRAYCWGLRSGGLIGDNGGESGAQTSPAAVVGLSGRTMVQISAGGGFTCALDTEGQVWCWGSNSDGQLGSTTIAVGQSSPVPVAVQQPAGVTFTAVTSGSAHACAIGSDDAIYCWGAAGAQGTGAGQTSPVRFPSIPVTPTWESVEE